jgi:hypothetical protein
MPGRDTVTQLPHGDMHKNDNCEINVISSHSRNTHEPPKRSKHAITFHRSLCFISQTSPTYTTSLASKYGRWVLREREREMENPPAVHHRGQRPNRNSKSERALILQHEAPQFRHSRSKTRLFNSNDNNPKIFELRTIIDVSSFVVVVKEASKETPYRPTQMYCRLTAVARQRHRG